jgi:fluoroquinolone resistance protein
MLTAEALREGDEFENVEVLELELPGFDLSGKDFSRCVFRRTRLPESVWRRARFEECVFEDCDLTRFVPSDVRAHDVVFRRCKLLGVEWTSASQNPDVTFEECALRFASLVGTNLRGVRFLRSQITEANFLDTDLSGADFSGSDLAGTTFSGTTLARADFTCATGAFFDPAKNRVKDARIPVETAALLASALGMKVAGYTYATKATRR